MALEEVSLLLGIWLGTTMLAGGSPAVGLLRVIDTNVREALTDADHVSILVFSMLLGGMVGELLREQGGAALRSCAFSQRGSPVSDHRSQSRVQWTAR